MGAQGLCFSVLSFTVCLFVLSLLASRKYVCLSYVYLTAYLSVICPSIFVSVLPVNGLVAAATYGKWVMFIILQFVFIVWILVTCLKHFSSLNQIFTLHKRHAQNWHLIGYEPAAPFLVWVRVQAGGVQTSHMSWNSSAKYPEITFY